MSDDLMDIPQKMMAQKMMAYLDFVFAGLVLAHTKSLEEILEDLTRFTQWRDERKNIDDLRNVRAMIYYMRDYLEEKRVI